MSKKPMSSDEKLEAAIALIKKHTKADGTIFQPVSLVQRHLLLGYSEAKSLIEEIKKMGVFHD